MADKDKAKNITISTKGKKVAFSISGFLFFVVFLYFVGYVIGKAIGYL